MTVQKLSQRQFQAEVIENVTTCIYNALRYRQGLLFKFDTLYTSSFRFLGFKDMSHQG